MGTEGLSQNIPINPPGTLSQFYSPFCPLFPGTSQKRTFLLPQILVNRHLDIYEEGSLFNFDRSNFREVYHISCSAFVINSPLSCSALILENHKKIFLVYSHPTLYDPLGSDTQDCFICKCSFPKDRCQTNQIEYIQPNSPQFVQLKLSELY